MSGARAGRAPQVVVRRSDVVIVGSGVAGLFAGLNLAPGRTMLLTKTPQLEGGSSNLAQGGMAAAVGPDDSPAHHVRDTLAAAHGLANDRVAELLATAAPGIVDRLIELGVRFDSDPGGRLHLGREAAHSRRRILHAGGDATGRELVRALALAVRSCASIQRVDNAFAWELVLHEGRLCGVMTADESTGGWVYHAARHVVLATGGVGRLYRYSTNPAETTADGLAMAGRAGAALADLEFVQFHPTALAAPSRVDGEPLPLLTEALRGEGALIVDEHGERFMTAVHPDAELAPRDVVARAVWRRAAEGGAVYLDARAAVGELFPVRFPTVFDACREAGIDPRHQVIPIVPAAHYHMGGVAVGANGRTSLPGLWAAGEVASTGVHGANRLASNSLLEALVFGARVARDIRAHASQDADLAPTPPAPTVPRRIDPDAVQAATDRLRAVMYADVGLARNDVDLGRALAEIDTLRRGIDRAVPLAPSGTRPAWATLRRWRELQNLLFVGRLITTAAIERRESRGAHYREDCPEVDPLWRQRQFVSVDEGEMPRFDLRAVRMS